MKMNNEYENCDCVFCKKTKRQKPKPSDLRDEDDREPEPPDDAREPEPPDNREWYDLDYEREDHDRELFERAERQVDLGDFRK